MAIFLTIIAILAAAYLFAAVVFHYGFKNWYPICGGKSSRCRGGASCSNAPVDKLSGS